MGGADSPAPVLGRNQPDVGRHYANDRMFGIAPETCQIGYDCNPHNPTSSRHIETNIDWLGWVVPLVPQGRETTRLLQQVYQYHKKYGEKSRHCKPVDIGNPTDTNGGRYDKERADTKRGNKPFGAATFDPAPVYIAIPGDI